MTTELQQMLRGELLDEQTEYTLGELCQVCRVSAECLLELVEEGILVPRGPAVAGWRFTALSVLRVQRVMRLRQDLGVNLAGAALALDLLDEMDCLRARLRRLEGG